MENSMNSHWKGPFSLH